MVIFTVLYNAGLSTVEPRFNGLPRDWGSLFVIIIKHLHEQIFRKTTKMFVIIEVPSVIKFQYWAIHTTVATALEIQEQANKTA